MNTLEQFIRDHRLNENEVMNALQENVVISDNCVLAADVCDGDCLLAIAFLKSVESGIAIPPGRNK